MKLVRNLRDANAITHGGTFHADDVFATVILDLYRQAVGDTELRVYRSDEAPRYIPAGAIMYDIGGGAFDHHQREGGGYRPNGVPYAACGLIWKTYGMELCRRSTNPYYMWRMIDSELIQPIDAVDCGEMPRTDYYVQPCTLSGVISALNPNWDDNESLDDAFCDAVDFAAPVFVKIAERSFSKVAAYGPVDACMKKSTGGILILDENVPWVDPILRPSEGMEDIAASLLFVVYPANRGGYQWRGIPDREGKYGLRKAAPRSWWGLTGLDLVKATGVNSAKFCHMNGFIGGAHTLEGCVRMAKLAISA